MHNERSNTWRWGVCGLLLLAAMLMYLDRLTLSQLATTICLEYALSDERFGLLATGFSFAFAAGALSFGFLVDRIGPRWLYPAVVIGWSCAGLATAYSQAIGAWFIPDDPSELPTLAASTFGLLGGSGDGRLPAACALFPGRTLVGKQAYLGFMICRIALGFFEAGHWPCALVTTRIILSRGDRTLGNSILQSGSSLGSILTPFVVLPMVTDELGGWRPPFTTIGFIGMLWVVPWLLVVRRGDLDRTAAGDAAADAADPAPTLSRGDVWRMVAVLVIVVISINLTWQYFSYWLPKFLQEEHRYTRKDAGWFTSAYYISAEIGCLGAGVLVKWLVTRGWDVHRAKLVTFTGCTALVLLAVAAAFTPTGALLLIVLLIVAAGSLGFYPNYYSFTQELTRTHQGKVSGALGTIAWIGSGIMQWLVGLSVEKTGSYATGIVMAGLMPLLACAALWLLWPRRADV
jgi:ACS family hexuronate transporter-like MFS transporter